MRLVSTFLLEQYEIVSDEELVAEVLAGQTALFELLMRRHNARLFHAARAIVRDDDEAEDVMQHAYVNAYASLAQFDGRARFATWLTRIAINESLARVRRRRRQTTLAGDAPADGGTPAWSNPERETLASELRRVLEAAIDALPDGTREVFTLRAVEGLSTAEVADVLCVSTDVVKTRLSRARSALQHLLLDWTGSTRLDVFRFYRPRCDRIVEGVFARMLPLSPFTPSSL
jgi:RNA polymerase sigma-70 factor, ECF subfamily